MNGLRGLPCSVSSCTIELNALPEGSRPARAQSPSPIRPSAKVSEKPLETDWNENGSVRIPARMFGAICQQDHNPEPVW